MSDMVVCLGDFSTVSGSTRTSPGVVGPFGCGVPNDNTDRLISFCEGARLRIAGFWYRSNDIHLYSWLSNDSQTLKEIDHILVSRRWTAIINCRVYRKFEFDTDHRAVMGSFKIRLKRCREKPSSCRHYDLVKLCNDNLQFQYAVEVQNRFSSLSVDEMYS